MISTPGSRRLEAKEEEIKVQAKLQVTEKDF